MRQDWEYILHRLRRATALVSAASLCVTQSSAHALPHGGAVGAGQAAISSSTNAMDVTQSSQRAVLNWQSFDIGSGESVNFHQPSPSAIALNRVAGGNESQILGNLNANGQVWLINPSGVVFGEHAQVNVGGLVATTSNISDSRFMGGNYLFDQAGDAFGAIVNRGRIKVADGGLAALVGANVTNSGQIEARLGRIHLASGSTFALDLFGDGLINLQASETLTHQAIVNSGMLDAAGGQVRLSLAAAQEAVSSLINLEGIVTAEDITIGGDTVMLTGSLSAANNVTIGGRSIAQQGSITTGGGRIQVTASEVYLDSESSRTTANGAEGGTIHIDGGRRVFASGTYEAKGDTGGSISFEADDSVKLYAAKVDASGASQGGEIRVGGGYQGKDATIGNANETIVNPTTTLDASATDNGDGGSVIVWSEELTRFAGRALATGGANGGNGGLIELSSKETLDIGRYSVTDSSSVWGQAGRLLLDPHNITISNTGITSGALSYFEFVDPNADTGQFGAVISTLASGNVVITDHLDDFAAADAGAVYLFNGATGGLISTLTGGKASDGVGNLGVTTLTNGNYVVASATWDNGVVVDAGAATWADGTTGIAGVVSTANSLYGSATNNFVGYGIKALTNDNYVVISPFWDNGAVSDVGAVTWGNGTTGITGAVSVANSLVGTTNSDQLGWDSTTLIVVALSNGNYVIGSPLWDNGVAWDAGAVTWGNGATGSTGAVSAANSLVGSTANDTVGNNVTALTNGNYVASSYYWDRGAVANAGAVTWGNGATGTTGAVSAINSLVGSTAGDSIGLGGVTALTNGNYVVASYFWDNGATANAGAATWGNGTTGITGAVSTANSLYSTAANDFAGTVTALTNGNYIVRSPGWDNGAVADAGAVTWGNGATGITGAISTANSLYGTTAGDMVGSGVSVALTNGNYVVASPTWTNGSPAAGFGAATWGNGATGTTGAVSIANSLYGTTANDQVGGAIVALSNGNFVVISSFWDNGAVVNAGAVTWGNGTTGSTGAVTTANSLYGTTAGDIVGGDGVTALTNGNYVVKSSAWNNGATADVGAATWGNGATGTSGAVSAANSLIGSMASDSVGNGGVTALSNGNYVVGSSAWDNGATVNAGAATLGLGTGGTVGAITSVNSIIGPSASSGLGTFVIDSVNGRVVVRFLTAQRAFSVVDQYTVPGDYVFAFQASSDVNLHPDFITGVLNAGTNVTLQANNDITVTDAVTANNAGGDGGDLTLQAGRSILINASIATDNGDFTAYANSTAADGVVDAQRDAGDAVITMANGTSIDAGTGAVDIQIKDGAGNTNTAAGDLTLEDISAASILARNAASAGDLILNGVLTASGADDAITLVSGRDFINNAGAGALIAAAGRWLVYSSDPADDTIGSLANDFRRFSCVYGGSCPSIPAAGNGLLYSTTPLLTISPDAANITYGDAAPAFTYTLSGYLGTDENDDNVTGSPIITTPYNQGDNAGDYDIVAAAGTLASALGYGFSGSTLSDGLTVDPAELTVTADNKTKTYGDADPGLTYQYTGLVNGDLTADFAGALTRDPGEDAALSPYAITIGTLQATGNYTIGTFNDGTLTINPAAITVTADAKSKTYGDADPALTYQITSGALVGGDAFSGALTRDPGEDVALSPYAITIGTLTAGSNYNLTYIGADLTINPAPLTVTADNKSKTYGAADPALTYQYVGLVNGDLTADFAGALTRDPGEDAALSPYAITIGTLQATGNYTIGTFNDGTLTIDPAPITVTADDKSKTYGDADPALTYQITSGALVGGDSFSGSLARAAGENVALSPYAIVIGSLSAGSNYDVTYIGASLTIDPAPLIVTAHNKTKFEGAADPALTYGYSGLVNGDLSADFIGGLARTAGETAAGSPYSIVQDTLMANGNYTIATFNAGTFTILAASAGGDDMLPAENFQESVKKSVEDGTLPQLLNRYLFLLYCPDPDDPNKCNVI